MQFNKPPYGDVTNAEVKRQLTSCLPPAGILAVKKWLNLFSKYWCSVLLCKAHKQTQPHLSFHSFLTEKHAKCYEEATFTIRTNV